MIKILPAVCVSFPSSLHLLSVPFCFVGVSLGRGHDQTEECRTQSDGGEKPWDRRFNQTQIWSLLHSCDAQTSQTECLRVSATYRILFILNLSISSPIHFRFLSDSQMFRRQRSKVQFTIKTFQEKHLRSLIQRQFESEIYSSDNEQQGERLKNETTTTEESSEETPGRYVNVGQQESSAATDKKLQTSVKAQRISRLSTSRSLEHRSHSGRSFSL